MQYKTVQIRGTSTTSHYFFAWRVYDIYLTCYKSDFLFSRHKDGFPDQLAPYHPVLSIPLSHRYIHGTDKGGLYQLTKETRPVPTCSMEAFHCNGPLRSRIRLKRMDISYPISCKKKLVRRNNYLVNLQQKSHPVQQISNSKQQTRILGATNRNFYSCATN